MHTGYGNHSRSGVIWAGMIGIRQNYLARLRAICAIIALLVGSTSASISLASTPSDVCAMACCIEEGHCCCSPPRASVKGQPHNEGPNFNAAEVSVPCPEGCTNPTTSSKTITRVAIRAASHLITFSESATICSEQIISEQVSFDLDSFSPRGPPLNFTPVA